MVEPLFFGITLATFLILYLTKPLSIADLLTHTHQLESHKSNITSIHNNVLKSRLTSIHQFKCQYENTVASAARAISNTRETTNKSHQATPKA
jgi:hypothetical protein